MGGVLAQDSPLLRFLSKVADVMVLNLLFIATSVPLVTLGASATALSFTAMRLVRDECESVVGDYLRSFRSNFRQATALALVLTGLSAVLVAWAVVTEDLVDPVVLQVVLRGICYLAGFRLLLVALYAFPYLAMFEGSLRDVLRNARLMSARHPLSSLTVLVVTALPVVLTVFYPRTTGYGLAWFVIGFAGVAFVDAVVFVKVFGRYVPAADDAPAADDEAWNMP